MAVRLRLARMGRKNRPFYRVGAFDARTRRDGRPIEYIGWYDPLVDEFEKSVHLEMDRVEHWLGHGAKCTETVASFIKRKGRPLPRNATLSGMKSRGKSSSKS